MTLTFYGYPIKGKVAATNDFKAIDKVKRFSPTRNQVIERDYDKPNEFMVQNRNGKFYKVVT